MAVEGTQFCANCKHNVPEANFTTHESHCRRHIALCDICEETVLRPDLQKHKEQEHMQIKCKCGLMLEKNYVDMHQRSQCTHRLVKCQYCDLELAFSQSRKHEDYCGSRTEPCQQCKCYVMLREQAVHSASCGSLAPLQEKNNSFSVRYGEPWRAGAFPPEERNNNCTIWNPTEPQSPFETAPISQDDHILGKISNTYSSPLSSFNNVYQPPAAGTSISEVQDHDQGDVMLPCELCEELFLEEDLILHQNRCSPASAFSSFSKHTPAPFSEDRLTRGAQGLMHNLPDNLTSNFHTFSRPVSPPYCGTPASPMEDVIIPCEFCGSAFDKSVIVHHQDTCDLRPGAPHPVDNRTFQKPLFPKETIFQTSPKLQRKTGASEDSMTRNVGELTHSLSDSLSSNFPTYPWSVSPTSYSPPAGLLEDVVIPCEFCGLSLAKSVIIHHQYMCDLRPRTYNPADNIIKEVFEKPLTPGKETLRQTSPDFHGRIKRHKTDTHHDGRLSSQETISHCDGVLKNRLHPGSAPASLLEGDVVIPCEFCDLTFNESDIQHHQDMCALRPRTDYPVVNRIKERFDKPLTLAKETFWQASPDLQRTTGFSKDRTISGAEELMHSLPDNLTSTVPTYTWSATPTSNSPSASPLEGEVVLPCEFCGLSLEESVILDHQDICDLRPRTDDGRPEDNKSIKATIQKPLTPVKETFCQPQDLQKRPMHYSSSFANIFGSDKEKTLAHNKKKWLGDSGLSTHVNTSNRDVGLKNRPHPDREIVRAQTPFRVSFDELFPLNREEPLARNIKEHRDYNGSSTQGKILNRDIAQNNRPQPSKKTVEAQPPFNDSSSKSNTARYKELHRQESKEAQQNLCDPGVKLPKKQNKEQGTDKPLVQILQRQTQGKESSNQEIGLINRSQPAREVAGAQPSSSDSSTTRSKGPPLQRKNAFMHHRDDHNGNKPSGLVFYPLD